MLATCEMVTMKRKKGPHLLFQYHFFGACLNVLKGLYVRCSGGCQTPLQTCVPVPETKGPHPGKWAKWCCPEGSMSGLRYNVHRGNRKATGNTKAAAWQRRFSRLPILHVRRRNWLTAFWKSRVFDYLNKKALAHEQQCSSWKFMQSRFIRRHPTVSNVNWGPLPDVYGLLEKYVVCISSRPVCYWRCHPPRLRNVSCFVLNVVQQSQCFLKLKFIALYWEDSVIWNDAVTICWNQLLSCPFI